MIRPSRYSQQWLSERAYSQERLGISEKLDVIIHSLDKIVLALEALHADRSEDKVAIYQANCPSSLLDRRDLGYESQKEWHRERCVKEAKEAKKDIEDWIEHNRTKPETTKWQ